MTEDTPEQRAPEDLPAAPEEPVDGGPGQVAPATPANGRRGALIALSALVWILAVALFAYAPAPVMIDGTVAWLARGTTVGDVRREYRLAGIPGDLVSATGRLLKKGAGAPPSVSVNGRMASASTVVRPVSRVSSAQGADVIEPVTTTVVTTLSPEYVGRGPVVNVESSGTPRTVEVVVGAISGEEASRRVISRGAPMAIRREPAWPGRREVALTFDDGPWPDSTDAVVSELRLGQVKATFFMLGRQVKTRPETARRVLAAGMEIGAHSYSHRILAHASHKTITREIAWGASAIRGGLGVRPVWYRPAGGSTNRFVLTESKRLGLRVVRWTVDPHDYRTPGAEAIARRVLNEARPGSVILMHDGGGDRAQTVAALGPIIRGLKARGYSMVTLSRLYRLPGSTP